MIHKQRWPSAIAWLVGLGSIAGVLIVAGLLVRGDSGSGETRDFTHALATSADLADAPPTPSATVDGGLTVDEASVGMPCGGIPPQGVFMTFNGGRYRLAGTDCGVPNVGGPLTKIGETDEIDIEHTRPVVVFQGLDGVLYTQQAGSDGNDQDWNRWAELPR